MNIGYFVSSHGFGHAARACAVIEKIPKGNTIFIFSGTPDWFFRNSLTIDFKLFQMKTDVGVVQDSPFVENLEATVKELDDFFPINNETIDSLTRLVKNLNIQLILCDISPLGIEVAYNSGIPSVLIENFTWDWIYEQYLSIYPQFERFIKIFKNIYNKSTLRFSVEPFCQDVKGTIKIPPVFRELKISREQIREQLAVTNQEKLILITMGGIPVNQIDETILINRKNFKFLFPISGITGQIQQGNFIFLPHNHNYFHPDLVNAADVVVGKLGYSTIAEVYSRQKPFLYVRRDSFRESKFLEFFVNRNLLSNNIEYQEIFSESIIQKIDPLLRDFKERSLPTNGSALIIKRLGELNLPLN